eukprot:TRINITY_DN19899_c0_g2_i3.p1 TRINITY_DN19899_c0_g2~~TRINITY_DN19899_c0_g2_i3.p1  ORF type:complete len:742 (-),score=169.44 TRINITY_DN19899_c0_g2_i3:265-2367(-)
MATLLSAQSPQGSADLAAERNRAEMAALRQEIASLLQTNGTLHQELGQLNGLLGPASEGASSSRGPAAASATRASDHSGSLFSAWPEEKKSLEARSAELVEQCRSLQMAAPVASSSLSASPVGAGLASAVPRLGTPGGPGVSSAASLAALLKERDDLHQQLHTTELARCAADQRRSTTEAALARTLEELDGHRKLLSSTTAAATSPKGELDALKAQLSEAQLQLSELDRNIAVRSERVKQNEQEYNEMRVEYDALASANEASRQELSVTRSRIAAEQQSCRSAEQELHELQSQLRMGEADFGTEVEALSQRRRALETQLRETSTIVATSEAELNETRAKTLSLQAQLEVLQSARNELKAQESKAMEEHKGEVARLEAHAEELTAEAKDLKDRRVKVQTQLADLQAENKALQSHRTPRQLEEDSNEERGRAAAAERCRKAKTEVAEAEQRLAMLLRRLGEERRQSLELTRELCAAREAATSGDLVVHPQGSHSHPKAAARRTRSSSSKRRSSSSSTSKPPQREVMADMREVSPSRGGWATGALQMHREIELLHRWKDEGLAVMRQMQVDVADAQGKYWQQLLHNQGLQNKLEQMGQQARDTVAALPVILEQFSGSENPERKPSFGGLEADSKPSNARPQEQKSEAVPAASMEVAPTPRDDAPKYSPTVLAGLAVSGPDMPERPDIPRHPRAVELLPGLGAL